MTPPPLPPHMSGEQASAPDGADGTEREDARAPERVAGQAPADAAPERANAAVAEDGDDEATVLRDAVRPTPPATSAPRKKTLAMAITRPVQSEERDAARTADAAARADAADAEPLMEIPNEVEGIEDEVDEWGLADQPTVYLPPRSLRHSQPRPGAAPAPGDAAPAARPDVAGPRPRPAPPHPPYAPEHAPYGIMRPSPPPRTLGQVPSRPVGPSPYGPRLATPTGRPMPGTPPEGIPRAALPDPRMQRFQELRQRRLAHEAGDSAAEGPRPVTDAVRQWWNDLMPALKNGLRYQREARASGVHPIPAHAQTTVARLGDAFGRLAASARELTERAQAAVAPAIKRIHDQAEQHADALVDKIEQAGAPRQQEPFLGPGRIAVFFRQGVSVGQAQALLAANRARPIRLIPRKHGFLALVPPGAEQATAERLRQHNAVRDVEYLEFDEYGQPAGLR